MALGGSRKKTLVYMFLWGVFWITIITYTFYYSSDTVRDFLGARV